MTHWRFFVTGGISDLVKYSQTVNRNLMIGMLMEHTPAVELYTGQLRELDHQFSDTCISVKLSNFDYDAGHCRDFFSEIFPTTTNTWNFDAEEHETRDKYNQITDELLKIAPPRVMSKTYQCYFPDTIMEVNRDLIRYGEHLGFKLVRGAYHATEPENVVYQRKEQTDLNYRTILKQLVEMTNNQVIVASHNVSDVEYIIEAHASSSDNSESSESSLGRLQTAQLMGMNEDLQQKVVASGIHSYLYVPYGPFYYCFPYLFRRLVENYHMMKHIR